MSSEDKKIKLLFIIGSHRKEGNSAKIVRMIEGNRELSEKIEIQQVYLLDKNIKTCRSCYKCSLTNECVLDDDVKNIVVKMKQADAILYVPVIYAFSSNSIFQSFMERVGFGFLRPQNRPLKDKFSTVIVIGRRYSHSLVATQVIMNILLNEMIIVGSGFLPLFQGVTFPGDIEQDFEAKSCLVKNVERLVEWAQKIKRSDGDAHFIDR